MEQKKVKSEPQKKRWVAFAKRCGHDATEVILIGVVVLSVLMAGAAWALHTKGIPLGFLKETIEQTVSIPGEDIKISLGDTRLTWPDLSSSLVLEAENVGIQHGTDRPFFTISKVEIGLSFIDLLGLDLALTSIALYEPTLRMIHAGNKQFMFSFAQEPYEMREAKEMAPEESIFSNLLLLLTEERARLPFAYRKIDNVRLEDAALQVVDFSSGRTLRLKPANIILSRTPEGLVAGMNAKFPKDYGEAASLNMVAYYYSANRTTDLKVNYRNVEITEIFRDWTDLGEVKAISAKSSGEVNVKLIDMDVVEQVIYDIQSPELTVDLGKVFDIEELTEETVSDLSLTGEYLREEDGFKVKDFRILHADKEFARLNASFKRAEENKATLALKANVSSIETETIDRIWPDDGSGVLARMWLVERIEKGLFKDLEANLLFKGQAIQEKPLMLTDYDWVHDVDALDTRFAFEGLEITYVPTLPPASNTDGTGFIAGRSMTIEPNKTDVGGMRLSQPGKLYFNDYITKGTGDCEITLNFNSSVSAMFDYLSHEPISFQQHFAIDVEKTKGNAKIDLKIDFPTVKGVRTEDVKVGAKATLNDLYIPDMVRGLALSGGPFVLETQGAHFEMKGSGAIGEAAADLQWAQYLSDTPDQEYSTKVNADIVANDALIKAFVPQLEGFITPPAKIGLSYVLQPNDTASIKVEADLTPAKVDIDMLGYKKSADEKAALSLQANMAGENLQNILAVNLSGPDLSIENASLYFNADSTLPHKATFDRLKIGETDAAIHINTVNDYMHINVSGQSFDARQLITRQPSKLRQTVPAVVLKADVDHIAMKNEQFLHDAKIYLERDAEGNIWAIDFDARTGESPISLHFHPRSEALEKLRFTAEDAGTTLQALGLFDTMRGGELSIIGESVPEASPQEIKGRMYVTNFTIVDTPFLAQLLNALSLPGLFALLEQSGISFEAFKSNFQTQKTEDGDWLVMFADGRTKGSSLGLTFEGKTNVTRKTLDVKGTIVPVSQINSFVSKIPLIGKAIAGGEGSAIFAATFGIKGEDKAPKVWINPLSVLAPGFLRKLFFEEEQAPIELQSKEEPIQP